MRTRLWAGLSDPAPAAVGFPEGCARRARRSARTAYQPAVALAAFAVGLTLVVLSPSVAGAHAPGAWTWALPVALATVVVAAGLATVSAVTTRRDVGRPLGRLGRLATNVVAGQSGLLALAEAGVTTGEDMAPLVRAVETLAAEVERSRRALDMVERSPDLTVVVDDEGRIGQASAAAASMLGRPADGLAGNFLAALVHPDDRSRMDDLLEAHGEQGTRMYEEIRLSHLHGHWVVTEVTVLDMGGDPGVVGRVLTIRDVSDRKAIEEGLVRRALYDPLTGLANRVLFSEHVDKALARLRRNPDRPHAVLFLDLDGFKTINDSLGHAAGDEVLAEVGRRLLRGLRPGDTVARLGGDEFAILVEYASHLDVGRLAQRILDVLLAPMVVQGKEVVLSGSVGIALSQPGEESDSLLRNADTAMYTAKAAGKGQFRTFEPEMHQAAMRRLDLEADLRQAIGRGELHLVYQPIVDLVTGRIAAAEVLARWKHPVRGFIPPVDFIPVAEESGYIRELGRHILEQACIQAAEWHRSFPGGEPLQICVNTSVRQIQHVEFFDEVARALAGAGLDGRYLTLEITESLFMSDIAATVTRLRRLKELGCKLAVDDFGTGYSSLSYLRSLPIDILKIDRSFVEGVAAGPEQSAVARAVVKLARTFNLRTIAEGIEQPEQAAELLAMGTDMGQGYLYARPLRADAMGRLLAEGRHLPGPALAAVASGS